MEKPATNLKQDGFYVLIAAAGSGQRFGGKVPKQYQKVAGKAILRHTIEAFLQCEGIKTVQVIIDPAHQDMYKKAVSGLNLPAPAFGSNIRSKSVFKGLKAFVNLDSEDKILIHDAARPLVRKHDIIELVSILDKYKAATLAVPVADTLRYGNDGVFADSVDRQSLWAIQTPQGFHYGTLMEAYKNADLSKEYTDETNLVSECGVKVAIVHGHRQNFKVTTPDDFELAKIILENSS